MRLAILILWSATACSACSCNAYPSVGDAWKQAAGVFGGEVIRLDPSTEPSASMVAIVRVFESFKGPGRDELLSFPIHRDSCSPNYRVGQRHLFFAGYLHGAWGEAACGRNRQDFSKAVADLRFLRQLPRSALVTRLASTVLLSAPDHSGPMVGTAVAIEGPGGRRTVQTDEEGIFELYGLPPGSYSITPVLPAGHQLAFAQPSGPRPRDYRQFPTVTLKMDSTADVLCIIAEAQSLSGRVLNAEGEPLPGVCLTLEATGEKGRQHMAWTNEEGRYVFADLSPGRYYLAANCLDLRGAALTYYPGVSERSQATVVSVARREALKGLDMRVARLERPTHFSGRVNFSDGTPAETASVELLRQQQRRETAHAVAGVFEISSTDRGAGELRAYLDLKPEALRRCPAWRRYATGTRMNSFAIPVDLRVSVGNLVLTFPVPACPGFLASP